MEIIYRKKFKKAFKKQSKKVQDKFFERIEIFQNDQFNHLLNNHVLGGEFEGVRSFDVTGDIRVHFITIDGIVILLTIGSHSELYS
jgi:mRNA-degrading endonuclease YafQ of YafQ-DinJ toxin-antitoxin module